MQDAHRRLEFGPRPQPEFAALDAHGRVDLALHRIVHRQDARRCSMSRDEYSRQAEKTASAATNHGVMRMACQS